MMDDVIYRKDAAKILCNWCGVCPEDKRDIMNCDDICPEFAKIPSAQSADAVDVVRCKDCKYFELNHWDGIIITAHEICSRWGSGCKTDKDGYCFMGERKTDV